MFDANVPAVAIVFLALSTVFVALALRDYLKERGALTPARKTWLLVAFIFAAIAIFQFIMFSF